VPFGIGLARTLVCMYPILVCMYPILVCMYPILVCMYNGASNVLQGVCSKFQFGELTKLTSEAYMYILTHVASGR